MLQASCEGRGTQHKGAQEDQVKGMPMKLENGTMHLPYQTAQYPAQGNWQAPKLSA
jgi:hypothetical protein